MADGPKRKRPRLVKLADIQGRSAGSRPDRPKAAALQLTHTRTFSEPQQLYEPPIEWQCSHSVFAVFWSLFLAAPSPVLSAQPLQAAALLGGAAAKTCLVDMQSKLRPRSVPACRQPPHKPILSVCSRWPSPRALLSPVLPMHHQASRSGDATALNAAQAAVIN